MGQKTNTPTPPTGTLRSGFPCKVRAKKLGQYGLRRRRPGDVFVVRRAEEFSKTWMERVPEDTPDVTQSTTDVARQSMASQLSGRGPVQQLQHNAADPLEESDERHGDEVL